MFVKEETTCCVSLCQWGYCTLVFGHFLIPHTWQSCTASLKKLSSSKFCSSASLSKASLILPRKTLVGRGERSVSQQIAHWITALNQYHSNKYSVLAAMHRLNGDYILQVILSVLFVLGLCNVFGKLHKANQCHNHSFLILPLLWLYKKGPNFISSTFLNRAVHICKAKQG